MEINGNEGNIQKLYILKIQNGKQIRNCKTSGNNRVFCRGVAS
jgi:hypothetical protein